MLKLLPWKTFACLPRKSTTTLCFFLQQEPVKGNVALCCCSLLRTPELLHKCVRGVVNGAGKCNNFPAQLLLCLYLTQGICKNRLWILQPINLSVNTMLTVLPCTEPQPLLRARHSLPARSRKIQVAMQLPVWNLGAGLTTLHCSRRTS